MTLEGKMFSHYRLLHLIGKGGMGEVYLAEDIQVSRQVAAKVMHIDEERLDQKALTDSLRLFQREARVIATLDHPGILPLYDHGETALEVSRFLYLILPYRAEGSLATWIRQRRSSQPLTPKQIGSLIQQAGQALQYAHEHQVMHLDVKPSKLLDPKSGSSR